MPENFVTPIQIDVPTYMAVVGRFAHAGAAAAVQDFFSGAISSALGTADSSGVIRLTVAELINHDDSSDRINISVNNYVTGVDDNDYLERAYIWGSTSFRLDDSTTFVWDNGSLRIDNLAILPYNDNFDFVSDNFFANAVNLVLKPLIGPQDIGRTLVFEFGDGQKDAWVASNTIHGYVQSDLDIDLAAIDSETSYTGPLKIVSESAKFIAALDSSGVIEYSINGKEIIYDSPREDEVYAVLDKASIMVGGSGDDLLTGSSLADILYGCEGSDNLYGGRGDDRLEGEDHGDVLVGGNGADTLVGGQGNDFLYGGGANGEIDGSFDIADYGDEDVGLAQVKWHSDGEYWTISSSGEAGTDTLYDVQKVRAYASTLILHMDGSISSDNFLMLAYLNEDGEFIGNFSKTDGVTITLREDRTGTAVGNETSATLGLEGVGTSIIASEQDDVIGDLSDDEKMMVGGAGNDDILVGDGDAVIMAGDGADSVVSGDGEDIIIDQSSVRLDDNFLEQVGGYYIAGRIASGEGDDTIVVSTTDAPLAYEEITDPIFTPPSPATIEAFNHAAAYRFDIDPGAGADTVHLDLYHYSVRYRYEIGDGDDTVYVKSSSNVAIPVATVAQVLF